MSQPRTPSVCLLLMTQFNLLRRLGALPLRVGRIPVAAVCIAASGLTTFAAESRPTRSLNGEWRFHFGSADRAEAAAFDDSAWTTVRVPHSWNAEDGEDGGANYARGSGWYRRVLELPADWQGRRVFLQFDGVSRVAEVFVNGRSVGTHENAFGRFRIDITDSVIAGRNVLAVRVSNAADGFAPVTADFTFFGGIYRDAFLFSTPPVHIVADDHGADGVRVEQRALSAEAAELLAKVQIRNATTSAQTAEVHWQLHDATGALAAEARQTVNLPAQSIHSTEQPLHIAKPRRWHGRKDPHLYRATVRLVAASQVDTVTQRIGLRTFRVDPDQGFFLNDEPLDVYGVNRHQDRAGKGWAISAQDEREDFAFIREIGATGVRVAHYPQSERWYDLADEHGLVLWAEIPVVNEVPAGDAFTANAKVQLQEMIRQHFHHPSIFFWGVGNETREVGESAGRAKPHGVESNRVIAELAALARREDPSRFSTYAGHHGGGDARYTHTDVIGFNKYFGWYGGKANDLGGWLDQVHTAHPQLRISMSEYGAGANPTHHDLSLQPPAPGGPWHPEEYQAYFHETQWAALATRRYVWGKFIWNLFDFAADDRAEGGTPGINDKGLVTHDRKLRKDAFYFYKAHWSAEPVLHLAGRRFTPRHDAAVEIKAYSNAPEVEVWVNGRSLGVASGSNRIFRWEAALVPGPNRIVARAVTAAGPLADECIWTMIPSPANPDPSLAPTSALTRPATPNPTE